MMPHILFEVWWKMGEMQRLHSCQPLDLAHDHTMNYRCDASSYRRAQALIGYTRMEIRAVLWSKTDYSEQLDALSGPLGSSCDSCC